MRGRRLVQWVRRFSFAAVFMVGDAVAADLATHLPTSDTSSVPVSRGFTSPGQFLAEHLVQPWLSRFDAVRSRPFDFPVRPKVNRSLGPLRQIRFLNGDMISSEIVNWKDDEIELRLRSGMIVTVPRNALVKVAAPAGETFIYAQNFEGGKDAITLTSPNVVSDQSVEGRRSLRLDAGSSPFKIDAPNLVSSRLQFWFRIDTAVNVDLKQERTLRIDFVYGSENSSRCQLHLGQSRAWVIGASNGRETQPIDLADGWHCLTAISSAGLSTWIIDNTLVSFELPMEGTLNSIRFSANTPSWIDAITLSKCGGPDVSVPFASAQDDVVTSSEGVQWFGRLKQVTQSELMLAFHGNEHRVALEKFGSFALRQSDAPVRGRFNFAYGLQAEIEFQPVVDRPLMPVDRITATILDSKKDLVIVTHPWLGTFAVGWTDIGRIRPLHLGQLAYLDARRFHLGDSIHENFRRQLPDGIEWAGEFDLPDWIMSQQLSYRLVVDVSEIEPSSPDTPPASPFLADLRRGELVTELTINGEAAGRLNDFVRFRTTPDRPEEILIPLKRSLLRAGQNSFRIKQVPKSKNGHYDNCELSNLRLEIQERE